MKRVRVACVVVAMLAASVRTSLAGVAGEMDPRFNGGQAVELDFFAAAVSFDVDGSLVVAGAGGNPAVGLARLHADGALDPSFGTGGYVVMQLGEYSSKAQFVGRRPEGGWLVTGEVTTEGEPKLLVAAFDAAGKLDSGFGGGGILRLGSESFGWSTILGLGGTIAPDGSSVVTGFSFNPHLANSYRAVAARVTATGATLGACSLVFEQSPPWGSRASEPLVTANGILVAGQMPASLALSSCCSGCRRTRRFSTRRSPAATAS